MENAADALIIAGAVFVLVIILSVTAFAFSNARESIDNIFTISDKEYMTRQGDEEYYYLSTSGLNSNITRKVGLETIIPSMYRAFSENYRIEFVFNDGYYLYKDRNGKEITSLDLSEMTITDSKEKDFLEAILYHTYLNESNMTQFNNDFLGNRNKN